MKPPRGSLEVNENTFNRLKALAEEETENIDDLINISGIDASTFETFLTETGRLHDPKAQKILAAYANKEKKHFVSLSVEPIEQEVATEFKDTISNLFDKHPISVEMVSGKHGVGLYVVFSMSRTIARRNAARSALARALHKSLQRSVKDVVTVDVNGKQMKAGKSFTGAQIKKSVDEFLAST